MDMLNCDRGQVINGNVIEQGGYITVATRGLSQIGCFGDMSDIFNGHQFKIIVYGFCRPHVLKGSICYLRLSQSHFSYGEFPENISKMHSIIQLTLNSTAKVRGKIFFMEEILRASF